MHRRAIKKDKTVRFRLGKDGRPTGDDSPTLSGLGEIIKNRLVFCAGAIVLMSAAFALTFRASWWFVVASIPLSLVSCSLMLFLERRIIDLHGKIMARSGRIQSGFIAFFIFLMTGILVFLFLVSYPMGLLADNIGYGSLAVHYGRWTVNLGIIISLSCWLRCVIRRL